MSTSHPTRRTGLMWRASTTGVRRLPLVPVVLRVIPLPADVAGALPRPAVRVLLDHVVEQLLDALAVGDRLQHRGAGVAGRLDGQLAGVDQPLPERLAVGDVGDPGQPQGLGKVRYVCLTCGDGEQRPGSSP